MKKVSIALILLLVLISIVFLVKPTAGESPTSIASPPDLTFEQLDEKYQDYPEYSNSKTMSKLMDDYTSKPKDTQSSIQQRLLLNHMLLSSLETTQKKEISVLKDKVTQLSKTISSTNYFIEHYNVAKDGKKTVVLKLDTETDQENYYFSWYTLNTSELFDADKVDFYLYSKENQQKYPPDLALSSFLTASFDPSLQQQQGLIVYKVPKKENRDKLIEIVTINDKKMEGRYVDHSTYKETH
ncbi:MAG: hypothetical protein ACTH54_00665 [Vagococcus salmoninarum]|uniref:hypothetical protein n=1 Tax=Vagococcus salmoninarum TaxID=2739 RepID=UPI003F9A7707